MELKFDRTLYSGFSVDEAVKTYAPERKGLPVAQPATQAGCC